MDMPRANPKKPSAPARRAPSPHKGMRLHKIWLPDMDSPEFIREARRACLAANRSPGAKEDQDFIDSISILNDLTEEDIPEFRMPE